MKFDEGWLNQQIDRAATEVSKWPLHKQEYMTGRTFTVDERIAKTKLRIKLLQEEIKLEEIALEALINKSTVQ